MRYGNSTAIRFFLPEMETYGFKIGDIIEFEPKVVGVNEQVANREGTVLAARGLNKLNKTGGKEKFEFEHETK